MFEKVLFFCVIVYFIYQLYISFKENYRSCNWHYDPPLYFC